IRDWSVTGVQTCALPISFLGGSGADTAYALARGTDGTLSVVGGTTSADFPVTAGALQPALQGPQDAFLTQLQPGGPLIGSTYLRSEERRGGEEGRAEVAA